MCSWDGKVPVEEIHKNLNMSSEQQTQLLQLVQEFELVFSSVPGKTTCVELVIMWTKIKPVYLKPYHVPYGLKDMLKQEIQKDAGCKIIIKPSASPSVSPVVLDMPILTMFNPDQLCLLQTDEIGCST